MRKLLYLSLAASLGGTLTFAQVFCQATTSSVTGSYSYIATEVPLSGASITPPGTNPTTTSFSNTSVGKLVGSINGGGTFSSAGVLFFDGAGNISVSAQTSPLGTATNVGTYSVNSDCTITVTLNDVFNTATTTSGSGNITPAYSKSSLIGLVLGGGTEIDLTAPQSTTSTNGNTPLATGQFASRLNIQLIRSFAYGCSVSSLSGSYGLIANGFVLSTSTTTTVTGTTTTGIGQPATLFAAVNFDGNGNLTATAVGSATPLASFQLSGTYTVNPDCSGTMTFTPASTTTGTGTGTGTGTSTTSTSIMATFVLTQASSYISNYGAPTPTSYAARPGIEFTLTNANETLSGYGRPQ